MPSLVVVLRALALLAFAVPALIPFNGRVGAPQRPHAVHHAARAPVIANFIAAGLFFPALPVWSGDAHSTLALQMALVGCMLAFAGAALVTASRSALGAAWSLVAQADEVVGLVTNGPYRLVRHPIYLGLTFMAAGQGVAYESWPAIAVAAFGLLPTFAWRAVTEERLLAGAFGRRYGEYRARTRLIIPGLL